MGPVQTWVTTSNPSGWSFVWLPWRKLTSTRRKLVSNHPEKISENNGDPEVHQPCSAAWDTVTQCKSKIRFIGQKLSFSRGAGALNSYRCCNVGHDLLESVGWSPGTVMCKRAGKSHRKIQPLGVQSHYRLWNKTSSVRYKVLAGVGSRSSRLGYSEYFTEAQHREALLFLVDPVEG